MALILGASGQLGTELREHYQNADAPTHQELDIRDHAGVRRAVRDHELVLNTTAFLRVDDCEDEVETAWQTNAAAVRNLAQACSENGTKLVHLSTDYVFGGQSSREPQTEADAPAPLNVYGITKLAGEHAALAYAPKSLVVRSAGLYGLAGSRNKGGNFVLTMLRLGRERDELRVVHDQRLTPTFTRDLAISIKAAVERELSGLLHITNAGHCSWYEFAAAVFELAGLDVQLNAISSAEYPTKAARPPYSVLSNARLKAAGITPLRPWRDALAAYLEEIL